MSRQKLLNLVQFKSLLQQGLMLLALCSVLCRYQVPGLALDQKWPHLILDVRKWVLLPLFIDEEMGLEIPPHIAKGDRPDQETA